MGYAFISYSSENQQSADAMRALLKKHQIETWMAPFDIPAGREYAEAIYEALCNCSCLVLLLTDSSQNSLYVKKEVNVALDVSKPIIPVKLEDIELNKSMKLYLNDTQIVPVHTIDESSLEIQSILKSVICITGQSKKAETAVTKEMTDEKQAEKSELHHDSVLKCPKCGAILLSAENRHKIPYGTMAVGLACMGALGLGIAGLVAAGVAKVLTKSNEDDRDKIKFICKDCGHEFCIYIAPNQM